MGFQQAAKSQQGSGIRCRLTAQVDADETTNGLAVVDGIFGTFIGETETLLHDIHAQHARQRSEEHTSELQSLMRISYAVFCLKKKNRQPPKHDDQNIIHTLQEKNHR